MNLHPGNQQAALCAALTLVHELMRLPVTEPDVTPPAPTLMLLQGPTQEPLSAHFSRR